MPSFPSQTAKEIPPVLKPLRRIARIVVLIAFFNTITTILAFWWLSAPNNALYTATLAMFLFQLAVVPLIAAALVFRFFR